MAIKLIAMDVDDTLITDERTIPDSCRKAIQAALARGVRVVLASGRMFQSTLPYAVELGINGPLITYNGALVKHTDGTVISEEPVPLAEALEVVQFAKQHDLHLNVYLDDELYVESLTEESEYYTRIAGVLAHPVGDLGLFLKTPPVKLLFVLKAPNPGIHASVKELFGHLVEVSSSKPRYIEVTRTGVSKGRALEVLAGKFGFERNEIMAIGDGLNDLTMIQFAGIGVAVRNASEEVRRHADYVTVSNEEGGVAEAIHKFVLE